MKEVFIVASALYLAVVVTFTVAGIRALLKKDEPEAG